MGSELIVNEKIELKEQIRNLKSENCKLRDENNCKLKEINNLKDAFREAENSINLCSKENFRF